jgi:hypothetical protein
MPFADTIVGAMQPAGASRGQPAWTDGRGRYRYGAPLGLLVAACVSAIALGWVVPTNS